METISGGWGRVAPTQSSAAREGHPKEPSGVRAPTALSSLGALDHFCHGQGAWLEEVSAAWRPWGRLKADAYTRRARGAKHPAWYLARARSLRRELARRVEDCGSTAIAAHCRCGDVLVKVGCKQTWVCRECQARVFTRLQRRARLAVSAHLQKRLLERTYGRGEQRRPKLLTLTVADTGDIAGDRAAIVQGWRRLRQWLHRRIGAFEYVMTWEVTPGSRGIGHVHAHVVVLWPYVDYAAAKDEWARATEGRAHRNGLDIEGCHDRGKAGNDLDGVERAAYYVAKYASKGGGLAEFDPDVAAAILGATYEQRRWSVSHGFWVPEVSRCTRCGGRWCVHLRIQRRWRSSFWQEEPLAVNVTWAEDVEIRLTQLKLPGFL